LQVFESTGTPYSDVLLLQARRQVKHSAPYNAIVFWLQVRDQAVHNSRLDGRVGKMLRSGLLDEIKALAQHLRASTATGKASLTTDEPSTLTLALREKCRLLSEERPKDDSEGSYQGLLQAIGYKEFEAYLDMIHEGKLSADEQVIVENAVISEYFASDKTAFPATEPPGTAVSAAIKALSQSVQRLLDVTHRYAKVQDRFIRNRFEKRNVLMHTFNTSNIDTWSTDIIPCAFSTVSAWIRGQVGGCDAGESAISKESESVETTSVDAKSIFAWKKYTCSTCDRTLNGEREWQDHLKSKGHKGALRYVETRERLKEERGVILPLKRKRTPSIGSAPLDASTGDGST
jgi:tRNA dimethylallyltransferase